MIKLGFLYYEKNKEITKKIIDPYFKIRAPKNCCICNLEKNAVNPINHTLKVIDFKENSLWICNSITSLACASQCGKIIGIGEFKENV